MKWRRATPLLIVVALLVGGCATANPSAAPRDRSPQVRCVYDRHEPGTRPLLFFLCIESP